MNKLHKSIGQLVASGAPPLVVVLAVADLKFPSFVQKAFLAGHGDTAFLPGLAKLTLVVC